MDAGSLAKDSRRINACESGLAPLVKETVSTLAQKSAGAEIPAGTSDCTDRSIASYFKTHAGSGPVL